MKKKKAFTLAEVLITLTIIGVIAAVTIPNLMQSYKKHEVEVRLKEAYSILTNATQMSFTENGRCYLHKFNEYLVPYLKINKIEEGTQIKDTYCSLNGDCPSTLKFAKNITNNTGRLTLSNGMQLLIPQYQTIYCGEWIVVDINGSKRPNTLGRDVFVFALATENSINNGAPDNYFVRPVSWGDNENNTRPLRNLNELSSKSAIQNFGCAKGQKGVWCAALIQQNGWKIPDNYPVKKW